MIKLLTIGLLLYVLYRLVVPSKPLKSPERDHLTKSDEVIDIDYEELD
jgi:hypothetical protein